MPISSSTTAVVGGGSGRLGGDVGGDWRKVGGGVLLLDPANQGLADDAAKLVCEASNEAGSATMEVSRNVLHPVPPNDTISFLNLILSVLASLCQMFSHSL